EHVWRRTSVRTYFHLCPPPLPSSRFPYTTLFRSNPVHFETGAAARARRATLSRSPPRETGVPLPGHSSRHTRRGASNRQKHPRGDRKSTRLNSSHVKISYAVFCLKKKTQPYTCRP